MVKIVCGVGKAHKYNHIGNFAMLPYLKLVHMGSQIMLMLASLNFEHGGMEGKSQLLSLKKPLKLDIEYFKQKPLSLC